MTNARDLSNRLADLLRNERGAMADFANTRVVCRPHNDEAARRAFGDCWMDRFTRGKRDRAPSDVQRSSGGRIPAYGRSAAQTNSGTS